MVIDRGYFISSGMTHGKGQIEYPFVKIKYKKNMRGYDATINHVGLPSCLNDIKELCTMDIPTYRLQGGLSHVSLSLGLAAAVQRDTSTLFFDIFSIQKTSLFRFPPSHDCEHAPNLPVSHL